MMKKIVKVCSSAFRRRVGLILMLGALCAGAADPSSSKVYAVTRKPNIIFFLADDQRDDILGCAGDPIVQTPTLDGLAAQGVRFENTFCEVPICAASRATLLSGLSQRTHGYNFGELPVPYQYVATSYPAMLKDAGYRIGFAGKYGTRFEKPGLVKNFDSMKGYSHPFLQKQEDGTLRHETDLCADAAIEFIKSTPQNKPFCMSVSFNATHADDKDLRPGYHFQWPESADGLYEDVEFPAPKLADEKYFKALPPFMQQERGLSRKRYCWRWDTLEKYQTNIRAYYRMITGIDNAIARVLKVLKEKGLDENTIIVYSADNGFMRGDRGTAGKWNHYEQSLRIPLIVCDPRLPEEQRGRVVSELVNNVDLPATFVDFAGLEIPELYQGHSLLPLLEGKETEWREDIFTEHKFKAYNNWHAVRNERYKYASYYEEEGGPYECLYDLKKDPTEFVNQANNPEYAPVLKKMKARMSIYLNAYPKAIQKAPKKKGKASENKSVQSGKTGDITSSAKPYQFKGKQFARLGTTPALMLANSLTWELEAFIDAQAADGSVLMGNRETLGHTTTFFKITPSNGVQLYKNGKRLFRIPATFPRSKWIKISVVKTGKDISVLCEGKKLGSAVLKESAPSMPCYLGGDPKVTEWTHGQIRVASVR